MMETGIKTDNISISLFIDYFMPIYYLPYISMLKLDVKRDSYYLGSVYIKIVKGCHIIICDGVKR